jgi:hypothetical protein
MLRLCLAAMLASTAAYGVADARSVKECRAIADAGERLACYDARAGHKSGTDAAVPAPVSPSDEERPHRVAVTTPTVHHVPARSRADDLKHRDEFDSRITSVEPLPHGYARIGLADGTRYDTTQIVARPRTGEAVHYRRTFLGTMFLDLPGRAPITVRLARQQPEE